MYNFDLTPMKSRVKKSQGVIIMKEKKEFSKLDYNSQLVVLAFTRTILQIKNVSSFQPKLTDPGKDFPKSQKTVQQLNF